MGESHENRMTSSTRRDANSEYAREFDQLAERFELEKAARGSQGTLAEALARADARLGEWISPQPLVALATMGGRFKEARNWASIGYSYNRARIERGARELTRWPKTDPSDGRGPRYLDMIYLSCVRAPLFRAVAVNSGPSEEERGLLLQGIDFARDRHRALIEAQSSSHLAFGKWNSADREAVQALMFELVLPQLALGAASIDQECVGWRRGFKRRFRESIPADHGDNMLQHYFGICDLAFSAIEQGDPQRISTDVAALWEFVETRWEAPSTRFALFNIVPLVLMGSERAAGNLQWPPGSAMEGFTASSYWSAA